MYVCMYDVCIDICIYICTYINYIYIYIIFSNIYFCVCVSFSSSQYIWRLEEKKMKTRVKGKENQK